MVVCHRSLWRWQPNSNAGGFESGVPGDRRNRRAGGYDAEANEALTERKPTTAYGFHYNLCMSEVKTVRLTESVKAAG